MSDDYANNSSTTAILNLLPITNNTVSINGNIETVGDRDWFAIYLTAGQSYTFVATRTGSNWSGGSNFSLGILDSTSNQIQYVGGTNTPTISFKPLLSDLYYLNAGDNANDDFGGQYKLTVSGNIPLLNANITLNTHYAYITDGTNGLQIKDISNATTPTQTATYDTSGEATDVAIKGTTAFIADGSAGLQVVDISNPAAPTRLATLDTTGTANGVAVSADDYAYIADGDKGLKIIDVYAPNAPVAGGSYDTTGIANDVAISGNYAYVTDGDAGLQVIDVSNPLTPTRVGGYDTTGTALGIAIVGTTAYIADGASGLQILNISNPAAPTRLGGLDTAGYAMNVSVTNNVAYVADGNALQAIDVSSPATPTLLTTYNNTAAGITTSGTFPNDHFAFTATSGAVQAVRVIPNNVPTGAVTISGNVVQGQTLTASNNIADTDGLGSITYTWKANGTTVGTGNTYQLTSAQAGQTITATANYTDLAFTAESVTSSATSAVTANVLPTGSVTITGSLFQGQTLTAHNTLADANTLGTITYTWFARVSQVATGDTYTLTAADVGKTFFVKATYTDGAGVTENVNSTATTAIQVGNPNNPPAGTVTISGNAIKGSVLTASNNLTDADGLGTISYSWQANGVNIGTGNTYTLTANEIGKTITAIASYTDNLNHAETITSSATTAVIDTPTAGVNIIGTDLSTNETSDTAVFAVSLKSAPVRDVTLNFTSSDTTEGVIITGASLKFTATNWSTPQTLTVTGQSDLMNDGNVAYSINAKISTLDVIYKTITVSNLTLTNQDVIVNPPETINGSNGTDVLQGTDVPSYMLGMAGDDDLSGNGGNDTLYGSYGDDVLSGNDDNDLLYGEQDADYLDGGSGNDTLDGGLGVDTMNGGVGNDTYYLGYDAVDSIQDNGLSSDIDTVIMPYQLASYTLPAGIEQGTITTGTTASNLTGNTSDNTLTGNNGKNSLNGSTGRDSLLGGAGNDTLIGGVGNDQLNGGVGKDIFKFDAVPASVNSDTITDFKVVDDTIQLKNTIFKALTVKGVLSADNFITATAAVDNNDFVIYNKANGAVLYDADGNGAIAPVLVTMIGANLGVTNADFVVV